MPFNIFAIFIYFFVAVTLFLCINGRLSKLTFLWCYCVTLSLISRKEKQLITLGKKARYFWCLVVCIAMYISCYTCTSLTVSFSHWHSSFSSSQESLVSPFANTLSCSICSSGYSLVVFRCKINWVGIPRQQTELTYGPPQVAWMAQIWVLYKPPHLWFCTNFPLTVLFFFHQV